MTGFVDQLEACDKTATTLARELISIISGRWIDPEHALGHRKLVERAGDITVQSSDTHSALF
jgi:hypothetical protein